LRTGAGTHYPECQLLRGVRAAAAFTNQAQELWVPAFAGTTAENLAPSRGHPGLSPEWRPL